MTTTQSQDFLLDTVEAHRTLLTSASSLFQWFNTTVKADTVNVEDFDKTVTPLSATIQNSEINSRLVNEWNAYVLHLRTTFATFSRDVLTRYGVDDRNHVRSFARNCASTAYNNLRQRSRDHLIAMVELP